jgi:hypothetical protein
LYTRILTLLRKKEGRKEKKRKEDKGLHNLILIQDKSFGENSEK